MVYRSLWNPDGTAEGLARGIATRMESLPSVTVRDHRVIDVSGHPAARVELTAAGTADALLPSGTGVPVGRAGSEPVLTRRVVVAIPRRADTLALVWHFPAALDHSDRLVDGVLATLRLADPPPSRASY